MFPKHNTLRPDNTHPLFEEMSRKRIGFSPLPFCEFFQGMEVLQIKGEETKEYVFALYAGGRLVGTVYFGDLYSDEQLLQIKQKFFPPTWDEIQNYVNEISGVWYYKMHPSQYAFVLENPNILKKIG